MKTKKETEGNEERILIFLVILGFMLVFPLVVATPTGPSAINITSNTTGQATSGTIINISGGYIAKLNLTATMQNPHWKGFAGWIDGKFTLDDSSGSTLYDWSLTSTSGEVYATRTSSVAQWSSIICANASTITAEDTALEHTGEDNITSTFSGSNSKTFIVAGTTISASACSATNTYIDNASQSGEFEEVILYDNSTTIIFATVLEPSGTGGYDGTDYDFQMIVPENTNETLNVQTAYYLYVELN